MTMNTREMRRLEKIRSEAGPPQAPRPLSKHERRLTQIPPPLLSREEIAHHEAGHAVAITAGGWPPLFVELYPHGAIYRHPAQPDAVKSMEAGTVLQHGLGLKPIEGLTRADLRAYALCSLAGPLAERMLSGDWRAGTADRTRGHHASDERGARVIIEHMTDGQRAADVLQIQVEIEAKALVKSQWPAIERVAAALLERGRLEGDDVARVVAEATGRKP
jgi:hypothetical protein